MFDIEQSFSFLIIGLISVKNADAVKAETRCAKKVDATNVIKEDINRETVQEEDHIHQDQVLIQEAEVIQEGDTEEVLPGEIPGKAEEVPAIARAEADLTVEEMLREGREVAGTGSLQSQV